MAKPLQTRRQKHKSVDYTRKQKKSKKSSPGDNFYDYINHSWLQKTIIPPTRSAFGVSEEVENRIEKQSKEIMKDCIELSQKNIREPTYMESLQQCLGTLAQSVQTADSQKNNIDTVHSVLASIQSVQSKEEVAVIVGEFTRYKIRDLFSIYGQYENKNRTEYTYTIGVGGLGLPDPSYYYKKSMNRGKFLRGYKRMLKRIGTLFNLPKLHCLVGIERVIAGVILQTDRDTIEHERNGSSLEKDFPHIPFSYIFETMGIPRWRSRLFIVESLRWLHTLNKLFHHLGIDHWKLLLSLQFILFALPWLPPPYSDISFSFYKKQLRGQRKVLSRNEQAIYVLEQYATPLFSRLYVEKLVNKTVKPHATSMVEDLLHFAEKRLASLEWLEPKTREAAQKKVEKMRYSIAYPDSFDTFEIPTLSENNLLLNLITMGEWQTNYEIQKLGQPITERKDWDDPVFLVNAYYYSQVNEIVIPVGTLQEPFFDEKAPLAWNYGGVGCIICHELTHAFDKEGKEYDPNGYQKTWWTSTDNRRYNEQTKALIELYEKQKVNGFPVSGKRTLSENIADIGGMGIALDALKHKLDAIPLTAEERHEAYRDFFTSYAISWRMKENKKKQIQALLMDKHAPPFLRVNLVVSQFQEWYDAFGIQADDKLFIPVEKRIRIF